MVDKTTWVFLIKSINLKQNESIIIGRYYSYIKGVMRKELKNSVENKTVDKTTWVFLIKSINHKQNERIIIGRYYSYLRK
jgi:DNA-directed RNA polymerase subunit E'/Rpb7